MESVGIVSLPSLIFGNFFPILGFCRLGTLFSPNCDMSTSFPSFCPKITNPLWLTSGEYKGDEVDVSSLESQYETWVINFNDEVASETVVRISFALYLFMNTLIGNS